MVRQTGIIESMRYGSVIRVDVSFMGMMNDQCGDISIDVIL